MTEDSVELHPGSEKASLENNKKRRLKTPAQVMALENFYNEYKYPTEEMKAKVAEEIGLTEKQVSGWFCHRRLKDKRSVRDEGNITVRQDRSSVVIQDPGSGHRQDSCGSTKQTDYRNLDPREAESQRLFRNHYMGNADDIDSTSSESSSSLQDRRVSGKEGLYEMEVSRYLTRNRAIMPFEHQVMRNTGYKPSGYLKVKGEIENAAITAVKRQLGRHYREDGPPLGVEFDSLPPGAFESPTNDMAPEPIYVGNHRRPRSSDGVGLEKNFNLGSRYEAHNSKMHSPNPYFEDEDDNKRMVGPICKDRKNNQQSRQRSPYINYSNPFLDQNSLMDMHEDSSREICVLNSKRGKTSSKIGAEGMRYSSVPNCRDICGANLELNRASLHDYENFSSKHGSKSEYFSKSSNSMLGRIKSPDIEESGPSIGAVGRFYGERNLTKAGQEKMHLTDEPTVANRVRHDYSQQAYATKATYSKKFGLKNQIKRSAMEVPSSFSEDETGQTSSSMELSQ